MRLNQKLADEVVAYIRSNLHKELRVKELARLFLVDPSSLERLSNIYLEQPLHKFIREEKLLKSAQLLETTDGTLYEIVDAIRLTSISTFSKQFKNRFGLPPGEYRKRCRKPQEAEGSQKNAYTKKKSRK
jgi:two-component system response regulator YesN